MNHVIHAELNTDLDLHIRLHSRSWVSNRFYEEVQICVEESIPALVRGARYTAKEICGDAFWNSLIKGERNLAGECLFDMVLKNLVTLEYVGKNSENAKLYQLK